MRSRPRIAALGALMAALCAIARLAAPDTVLPPGSAASGAAAEAGKLPPYIALPSYKLGTLPFHPGQRLQYQASWVGIPAATADVQLSRDKKDASLWLAQVLVKTNPVVDLLFKMRDSLTEAVAPDTLAPQKMYIRQSENKRLNYYNVTFDRRAGVVTMVKSNRKGRQVKQFLSPAPWGPVSGSLMALSQPLAVGNRYVFDVFTGTTRYVFDFKVAGRETISTAMGTFDTFRLVPGVLYESSGKLDKSATGTTIWVTADQRHLPVRAQAQAFVGWIRADLVHIDG